MNLFFSGGGGGSMSKETWRWIPGSEGEYRVSDFGRVESVRRKSVSSRGVTYTIPGRILNPYIERDGYHEVGVYINGHRRNWKVHQLVLMAFVGPCPEGMECRHLDGDPGNNKLTNLCWGTSLENKKDSYHHGTYVRGVLAPNARLTDAKVRKARRLYATGNYSYGDIAEMFDVASCTVRDAVRGTRWKHVK